MSQCLECLPCETCMHTFVYKSSGDTSKEALRSFRRTRQVMVFTNSSRAVVILVKPMIYTPALLAR